MKQKPTIVIIEGPDGSGKTTLADYLAEGSGAVVRHSGVPSENPLLDCMEVALIGDGMWTLIVDRLHLGEQVYGPIMRRGDKLGLRGRLVFEKWLMQFFNVRLIICLPPLAECLRNWKRNHENEYVKDTSQFIDVWHSFNQVATTLHVTKYNYLSDDAHTIKLNIPW